MPVKENQRPGEQALEEAVSRALRDNLIPLQRTANELHQAYADLVAACASSRPSNALPAMLRAQTAASALAAGLSVLSNFMAVALKPRDRDALDERPAARISVSASALAEAEIEEPPAGPFAEAEVQIETPPAEPAPALDSSNYAEPESAHVEVEHEQSAAPAEIHAYGAAVEQPEQPVAASITETPAFDVANLPSDMQDLHRRANRVAKVAMQDIKLLRPKDVRLGRENSDICTRLRSDLDKARKEYDRRFQSIQDHPVDYFHHWMVEILAEGNVHALGDYPYPSPVLRH
jgi:hypothetical protein